MPSKISLCKIVLVFFVWMSALSFAYVAKQAPVDQLTKTPIRIINIGDSITQGGLAGRPEYTYRLPLYIMLHQHHVNVDFIGAHHEGLSKDFAWPKNFDVDNEGFYGAKTIQVRDALRTDLDKIEAPDIAIIDLGSNDVGSDVKKAVIKPLREIIVFLRQKNPNVKIILVQIPGVWQNLLMHFYVWRLAYVLEKPESPIETVALYWGWNTKQDTFDGSHPNLNGQHKMAEKIYEKLALFLKKSN